MRPRGLEQRFAFLSPMNINVWLIVQKPDDIMAYVLRLFMANKDTEKLYFLPYNTGNWLDFHSNFIYYNFSFFSRCVESFHLTLVNFTIDTGF